VASGDARHTGLNPVACYVSFETRAFEIYATLPAGPRRYLLDILVQFVSLTHIVANAELENNNTG